MSGAGLYGCPLCDRPAPHEHQLATILNSMYYCADGSEHQWGPARRWGRPRCTRCGEKQRKDSA